MIGSNFSLRVSVRLGKAQMGRFDPGRQTLLGAENPAKAWWSAAALGTPGVVDVCLVFTLYRNLPSSCDAQKMETCQGKSLPQIHTQIFLKRFIKSWRCMRQEMNEGEGNVCASCNGPSEGAKRHRACDDLGSHTQEHVEIWGSQKEPFTTLPQFNS